MDAKEAIKSKILGDVQDVLTKIPVDAIYDKLPGTVKLVLKKDTINFGITLAQDAVQSDAFCNKIDNYVDMFFDAVKDMVNSSRRDTPDSDERVFIE